MAATNPGAADFEVYCNLDEAGGSNALDSSPNGHDLTETSGTIASAEGGRDFELADTEYFTKADHADYSFADEAFTVGCWVKLESEPTSIGIIGKYNATNREYLIFYKQSDDRFMFYVSSNGTTSSSVTANNYGNVTVGAKVFILAWHDPVANKIYISVNNGAADELVFATGCNDNTSPFAIGCFFIGGAPTAYMDGIMWSSFVARKNFTADERTWLYNSGTPRKWSEIAFRPKVAVVMCDFGKTCKRINGLWQPRNLGLSVA